MGGAQRCMRSVKTCPLLIDRRLGRCPTLPALIQKLCLHLVSYGKMLLCFTSKPYPGMHWLLSLVLFCCISILHKQEMRGAWTLCVCSFFFARSCSILTVSFCKTFARCCGQVWVMCCHFFCWETQRTKKNKLPNHYQNISTHIANAQQNNWQTHRNKWPNNLAKT